jgi:hypothetical protein
MGIFPYEIVLRDIPFKKVMVPKRRFEISAGSYKFQRGHIKERGHYCMCYTYVTVFVGLDGALLLHMASFFYFVTFQRRVLVPVPLYASKRYFQRS